MNVPIFQENFNPNDYINFKKIPNGIELTHDNVKDVSLFEHLGDVTKVNLYHKKYKRSNKIKPIILKWNNLLKFLTN